MEQFHNETRLITLVYLGECVECASWIAMLHIVLPECVKPGSCIPKRPLQMRQHPLTSAYLPVCQTKKADCSSKWTCADNEGLISTRLMENVLVSPPRLAVLHLRPSLIQLLHLIGRSFCKISKALVIARLNNN